MKKFIKPVLLATLIFITFESKAQKTKEFPKDVNLIKMTDPGVAIVGTNDALYGIDQDGNVMWSNEKLKKVEENRVEVLSGSELIFVSDKGALSRNRVINVLNGTEYADTGLKYENVFGARIAHGVNQLWVMPSPKVIEVWDIDTNEKLYKLVENLPYGISTSNSAALTATFSGMQPITYTSGKNAILHLGLGHLGHYDLLTGKAKWLFDFKPYKLKKPNGDKGDRPSNPGSGSSVMKLDQESNTLYFPFRDILIALDANSGQPKWDPKVHKIGKIRDMYVTNEGILVLTLKGLQLINKSNGALVWDKPIKIKGADEGLLINEDEKFYIVSKNTIVKVDISSKSAKTLTEKIKFQGGESFSGLEILDNTIILSGSQNIVGVDKNSGKVLYNTYYKAPGAGLVAIAQNMALATIAMAATMNSQSINSRAGNKTYHQYTPAMISSGGSASNDTGQIMYISTKFNDNDAKGFGLARIDKSNGETTNKIVIGDRNPIYDVDERAGIIYFKSGKKGVSMKTVE